MNSSIEFDVHFFKSLGDQVSFSLYDDLEQQGLEEEMFIKAFRGLQRNHRLSMIRKTEYLDDPFDLSIDGISCLVKFDPAVATIYISCNAANSEQMNQILNELNSVDRASIEAPLSRLEGDPDELAIIHKRPMSPETKALFEGLGIPLRGGNLN